MRARHRLSIDRPTRLTVIKFSAEKNSNFFIFYLHGPRTLATLRKRSIGLSVRRRRVRYFRKRYI